MSPERRKKVVPLEEAVSYVSDGCFLAIGGFMIHNHPMGMIREIVKRKIRNLRILPTPPGGSLDADLLIGSGCARSVLASYIGGEWLQPIMPNYRRRVENGELEILEFDEMTIICGLRAAGQRLPCEVTRSGLGSDMLKVNPLLKVFNNPITGEPLVAVPAIEPDIAILHAQRSDPYGNIQHQGSVFMDLLLASASRRVIVSVEEVVPNDFIKRDPFKTTIPNHLVTAVVKLPYGAHPCSSHGYYLHDESHIKEYIQSCKSPDRLREYLNKYVYGPEGLPEYLEMVGGIKRLWDLRLY